MAGKMVRDVKTNALARLDSTSPPSLPPSLLCRIGIYTLAESILHTSSPLRYLDSLIYFRNKVSIKETPLWLNPFPVHTIVPVPKSQNTIGQFPQKSCRMPSPPQPRCEVASRERLICFPSLAGCSPAGIPPLLFQARRRR